jgi:Ca2+-binding RTX toxin-like protein
MKCNDKNMTGQLAVRDGVFKARVHPMVLKVCLGLLAGFWLASAQAQIDYTPLILDDPTSQVNALFGNSVAEVGDVNDDGIPDHLVGAPAQFMGGIRSGQAFVLSGADGSRLLTLDDPTPQTDALFGWSVAGAGDVNSDGRPDLLVGAPRQNVGGNIRQGQAFVFSGADGSRLLTLDDPTPQAGAEFGIAVAGAGDVNSDGRPDLLVGAPRQNVGGNIRQGQAFVFNGADGSLLLTLDNPTPQTDALFGGAVAGAGDVNDDGSPDLLVGASGQTVGGNLDQGQAFVLSGADGSRLLTLDDPTPQAGARFSNPPLTSFSSGAVAGVSDVNGDSIPDLLVGADEQDVNGNANQGQAFVFSGADGSLLLTLDNPTPQAFAEFGFAVAGAGDVNGDGRADLLVGADEQDVNGNVNQGQAFVFSGVDGSLLLTLDNPTPQAGAFFAGAVAGAGDVNSDGRVDLLVGAPGQDAGGNFNQGQAVLFVSVPPPVPTCFGRPATIIGTEGNDILRGTPGDDVIVGLGGNDVISGFDGDDLICGGAGNDLIRGNAGNDKLSGDEGNDTLVGGIGDDLIEGGAGNDLISGEDGNDQIRGGEGDDSLSGGNGDDLIEGGAGRDFAIGGSGNDLVRGNEGDDFLSVLDGIRGNDLVDGGPHINRDLCLADRGDAVLNCNP